MQALVQLFVIKQQLNLILYGGQSNQQLFKDDIDSIYRNNRLAI